MNTEYSSKKWRTSYILIIILIIMVSVITTNAHSSFQPSLNNNLFFDFDSQNTGRTNNELSIDEPEIKWKYNTGWEYNDLALSEELIFTKTIDGKIIALDHEGDIKWEYDVGYKTETDHEGTIYYGGVLFKNGRLFTREDEDTLAILNTKGVKIKDLPLKSSGYPFKVSVSEGGDIYIGGNNLTAFSKEYQKMWMFEKTAKRPTIGTDGTVYSANSSHFYALDPDGNLRWSNKLIAQTYPLDAGRLITVTSEKIYNFGYGKIRQFDKEGNMIWEEGTGQYVTPVCVDSNNNLYTLSKGITEEYVSLVCLDTNGGTLWSTELEKNFDYHNDIFHFQPQPLITEKNILVSVDNELFCFNIQNGKLSWSYSFPGKEKITSDIKINSKGNVLVKLGGTLYSLGDKPVYKSPLFILSVVVGVGVISLAIYAYKRRGRKEKLNEKFIDENKHI